MIIFQQAAALEQHFGAANLHQQLDQRQLQMLQQHHIQQQQQQMEHMMRRPEDSNIMQVIDLKSLEYTVLGTFISIICYVFFSFSILYVPATVIVQLNFKFLIYMVLIIFRS